MAVELEVSWRAQHSTPGSVANKKSRVYFQPDIGPQLQIRLVALHRNHLHVRVTVQFHHSSRYAWDQHSYPRAGQSSSPPSGWPWRQPAPGGRDQEHDATEPAAPPSSGTGGLGVRSEHAPSPPRVQPVADVHQDSQDARLLPRMEGPQREWDGGGGVPGCPGGGEGGVHGRPGQQQGILDSQRVQRPWAGGYSRVCHVRCQKGVQGSYNKVIDCLDGSHYQTRMGLAWDLYLCFYSICHHRIDIQADRGMSFLLSKAALATVDGLWIIRTDDVFCYCLEDLGGVCQKCCRES